jgi:hypothetical protein
MRSSEDLLQEGFEFGAGLADPLRVDQRGMARRLTQSEQGLEDLDLGFLEPFLLDPTGELLPVEISQLVIVGTLRLAHLAVQRLLGLVGQVVQDLLFGPPQQIGFERCGQRFNRRVIEAVRSPCQILEG